MNDITINIIPSLVDVGNAIANADLAKEVRDIITEFAFSVESYSKQVTPVDTGRLRASIGTSLLVGDIGAKVSTNTEYAGYVHWGTKRMKARPFMLTGFGLAAAKFTDKDMADRLDTKLRQKLSIL